ncbi:hypothetical protein BDW22DRAFT_1356852 [Trametopsis cervina]|nr:hypothetical protein BDW22DRAFT_1356852 [Trametopsis cervina]
MHPHVGDSPLRPVHGTAYVPPLEAQSVAARFGTAVGLNASAFLGLCFDFLFLLFHERVAQLYDAFHTISDTVFFHLCAVCWAPTEFDLGLQITLGLTVLSVTLNCVSFYRASPKVHEDESLDDDDDNGGWGIDDEPDLITDNGSDWSDDDESLHDVPDEHVNRRLYIWHPRTNVQPNHPPDDGADFHAPFIRAWVAAVEGIPTNVANSLDENFLDEDRGDEDEDEALGNAAADDDEAYELWQLDIDAQNRTMWNIALSALLGLILALGLITLLCPDRLVSFLTRWHDVYDRTLDTVLLFLYTLGWLAPAGLEFDLFKWLPAAAVVLASFVLGFMFGWTVMLVREAYLLNVEERDLRRVEDDEDGHGWADAEEDEVESLGDDDDDDDDSSDDDDDSSDDGHYDDDDSSDDSDDSDDNYDGDYEQDWIPNQQEQDWIPTQQEQVIAAEQDWIPTQQEQAIAAEQDWDSSSSTSSSDWASDDEALLTDDEDTGADFFVRVWQEPEHGHDADDFIEDGLEAQDWPAPVDLDGDALDAEDDFTDDDFGDFDDDYDDFNDFGDFDDYDDFDDDYDDFNDFNNHDDLDDSDDYNDINHAEQDEAINDPALTAAENDASSSSDDFVYVWQEPDYEYEPWQPWEADDITSDEQDSAPDHPSPATSTVEITDLWELRWYLQAEAYLPGFVFEMLGLGNGMERVLRRVCERMGQEGMVRAAGEMMWMIWGDDENEDGAEDEEDGHGGNVFWRVWV